MTGKNSGMPRRKMLQYPDPAPLKLSPNLSFDGHMVAYEGELDFNEGDPDLFDDLSGNEEKMMARDVFMRHK